MTADAPAVSVVMPTFNGERHLPAALDSLEAQLASGITFEVLAADDGSTDETPRILAEAAARLPLRVVDGPRKRNWVASTNALLRLARGGLVTMLHQDDLYFPGRLAALTAAAAAHPDIPVFAHPTRFIDASGAGIGKWTFPAPANRRLEPREWFPRLLVQNNLAVPSVMFRRRLLAKAGMLDEALPYTADWDYWLRLAADNCLLILPEPLAGFRIHGASQTVAFAGKGAEYERNLREIVTRHEPHLRELDVPGRYRRLAWLGVEANLWLAAKASGRLFPAASLFKAARRAGLAGALAYPRLAQVVPRTMARLRARNTI